ncbi:MAG: hypothetical protein HYV38_01685 [Candidatus Levybacteria bacterium]|nr:hypothetical protein [Candidatus Levybacteria bacterium]
MNRLRSFAQRFFFWLIFFSTLGGLFLVLKSWSPGLEVLSYFVSNQPEKAFELLRVNPYSQSFFGGALTALTGSLWLILRYRRWF